MNEAEPKEESAAPEPGRTTSAAIIRGAIENSSAPSKRVRSRLIRPS